MSGYNIQMNNEKAVSQVINHLGTGIPEELSIRELVVNGIEACMRNQQETSNGVWIQRDFKYHNKLAVINSGGDYLSEEIFRENLATLGNSGNSDRSGNIIMDENKGIGAKIAYLPKARLGLLYRSIEKDEPYGIMAMMCSNAEGIYHLPSLTCDITGEKTSWPYCDEFSDYLYDSDQEAARFTGTEVVCLGDFDDEDTWFKFDKACSLSSGANVGGTGYGIFRYLTHRLWNEPEAPVRVAIYDKKNSDIRGHYNVKGLKHFMTQKSKKYGSVELDYDDIKITAHWCIIRGAEDEGYVSNWAASGKTAIVWKGESYAEFNQHHLSIKKELNDCGIIINYKKVMIMFEVSSDVTLNTNAGRTELFYKNLKIDKSLLHEEFRNNLPQELKDWQEENQVKDFDQKSFDKDINSCLKEMGFGPSTTNGKSTKNPFLGNPSTTNNASAKKKKKINKSKKTSRKVNAISNLNKCQKPKISFVENESDPMVEFHLNEYQIVINLKSDLFNFRKDRIKDRLGQACLVEEQLNWELRKTIFLNACYRIFETNINNKDIPIHTRKEMWSSEHLESAWGYQEEARLLKVIRAKNKKQKLVA
jgi:hypothetical protein